MPCDTRRGARSDTVSDNERVRETENDTTSGAGGETARVTVSDAAKDTVSDTVSDNEHYTVSDTVGDAANVNNGIPWATP